MVDYLEGGVVRVDSEQLLADASVFVVDFFGLHVHDVLVEGFEVLRLGTEFIGGVVCFGNLVHFGEQDFVLVIDLYEAVCMRLRVPRRLISCLLLV